MIREEEGAELPEEFRGVKPEMIEQNIVRLQMDMEAEIATIRQRYTDKIDNLQSVLAIARQQQARQQRADSEVARANSASAVQSSMNSGTLIKESVPPAQTQNKSGRPPPGEPVEVPNLEDDVQVVEKQAPPEHPHDIAQVQQP